MGRVIVALSGGKASAWCAKWALDNYPKEDVVLYFNDTKWEHKDLYRFLDDLSKYFDHPITTDSDGRSPEDLFYWSSALANNRWPFCSKILKADRLQKFYNDGDTLVFGIGVEEPQRVVRIVSVYEDVQQRTGKRCKLRFPLVNEGIDKYKIDDWLKSTGIEQPAMYKMGFPHNNCSGGCVRAGKRQWEMLYRKIPEVYAERERVEREVREYLGKDVSILKDITLENLRKQIEGGTLVIPFGKEDESDCIGICSTMS